jgi:hypothetical protein
MSVEAKRNTAVALLVGPAGPVLMIVCGTAPDGRPAPIVVIASLAPGEQLAFGENRWI